jgi:hypothetical protein
MKLTAILILGFCAVTAHAQSWKPLFDGKTMTGWQSHNADDWRVENGALACDGSKASWLSYGERFTDFQLQLEFKGVQKVNSGVFLRSDDKTGEPHITGYELQIWDYQPQGYLTGSLVNTANANTSARVIGDKWNRYDITAKCDHITVVLNGKQVLDTHDAKHAAGVIGFQCQPSNPIQFRKIRIRPL